MNDYKCVEQRIHRALHINIKFSYEPDYYINKKSHTYNELETPTKIIQSRYIPIDIISYYVGLKN
jgi:hypothetical protein